MVSFESETGAANRPVPRRATARLLLERRSLRNSILLLATSIPFLSIGSAADARCLTYEPTQVSLDGKLTTRSVPGPPGYVSIARGDHPETIAILVLDAPICVTADNASSNNAKGYTQITEVQLVMPKGSYTHLVDKQIRVTGTLSAARSRHHRTPVVMSVKAKRSL